MSYLPLVIISVFFCQVGLHVIHISLPEGSSTDEVTAVPEELFCFCFCHKLIFLADMHCHFELISMNSN